MVKFKYNQQIRIIKDEENEGFYLGVKGIIKGFAREGIMFDKLTKNISNKDGLTCYEIEIPFEMRPFYALEDEIESCE